jgi:uncharacterized iron-regulated protein
MKSLFVLIFLPLFFSCAHATSSIISPNQLFDGLDGRQTSYESMIQTIPQGSIILLGEVHNLKDHHQNHMKFLKARFEHTGRPVHVALEFLSYTFQNETDAYTQGQLNDEDFIQAVEFGKDFPWYRPKILFSKTTGGRTLAINAPRALTRTISREGLAGLSLEQRELLPPDFTRGRSLYYDRFLEVMSGGAHPLPPAALERFFWAQSLWDDTMAWSILEWHKLNPDDDIVVIVGDFHAIYGGGLEDRLRARGASLVTSFSQVDIKNLTQAQRAQEIYPHSNYGKRADYIFTTSSEIVD